MSTIAYRPNAETKQQLEELDALIQRMLGLPLSLETDHSATSPSSHSNRPGSSLEPTPAPQAGTLTIKPVPSTSANPSLSTTSSVQAWRVEMPAPIPEAIAAPEVPWATAIDPNSAPLPLPRFKLPPVVALPTTLPKFAVPPQLRPPVSPLTSLPPMAEQVSGASIAIPGPAALSRPNVPSSSQPKLADEFPIPWILWPIIGFNRVIELFLFCFGPLGKLFTHSLGRNVMGALGILMILGAIGWGIADWLGVDWTR